MSATAPDGRGEGSLQPGDPAAGLPEAVLVVDDEPALLKVATRILEGAGFQVLRARSGRDALAIVREGSERLDLVILDVILPDVRGDEVASEVLELRPATRIVVMSGSAEPVHVGMALDARVVFLLKPFTAAQLLDAVHRALEVDGADAASGG